ncbi:hypothetical protein GEMRC1_004392 [Eukaryota sp. GEM-RC1]
MDFNGGIFLYFFPIFASPAFQMSSLSKLTHANRQERLKQLRRKEASDTAASLTTSISKTTPEVPTAILSALTPKSDHSHNYSHVQVSDEDKKNDAMIRFEREKNWAIHQLELGIKYRRSEATKQQIAESKRVIKTLNDPKVGFPRKRHLLHVTFGGKLRELMAKEDQ